MSFIYKKLLNCETFCFHCVITQQSSLRVLDRIYFSELMCLDSIIKLNMLIHSCVTRINSYTAFYLEISLFCFFSKNQQQSYKT
ncbi:hypothetical protein EWB00_004528 [Schistosoma japonicum]|uniref:Uncharacterized protein n=1 Tax=Schistosoma japonicum TaxID=6182 RepID=A0A4Z2DUM1_SCHJA|nr:hypothetical protein KSF78_0006270 [Schistosoma japonicum]TNN20253.1 hypothetical protein EWB00_004528 [Schistosoma japonicum]